MNPYKWEAYSLFYKMTPEYWAFERPHVRKYLSQWPKWSLERRRMAKQGVLLAREDNVRLGVPGWR